MKTDDSELLRLLLNERRTVELCGSGRDGVRCIRDKDHAGPHECLDWRDGKPLTWE
jgi:hypothetical protein